MISHFALSILVTVAALAWAAVLSAFGWIIPTSFFRPLSIIVGFLSISLLAFDGWAWAWPGIRGLINRPDLRGTWEGVLRSNWKPPDRHDSGTTPINAYVVIHQTYSGLRLRLFTRESHSSSITAELIAETDGVATVCALYRNEPKALLRSGSPIHHGGLVLRVGGPPPDFMEGNYWTDRQTLGEVELRRVSNKRAQNYQAAEALGRVRE